MKQVSAFIAATLILATLGGCGSSKVHKHEQFELESQYRESYAVSPRHACTGAKRALLSQGYSLDENLDTTIKAHKEFQPEDENMTVLEFSVTCMPGGQGAVVFANAIESVYKLKKTSDSVGVGVSSVGSIKLPWGKRLDSLVKTSGTTIDDKKFYKRFFKLVGNIIVSTPANRFR